MTRLAQFVQRALREPWKPEGAQPATPQGELLSVAQVARELNFPVSRVRSALHAAQIVADATTLATRGRVQLFHRSRLASLQSLLNATRSHD